MMHNTEIIEGTNKLKNRIKRVSKRIPIIDIFAGPGGLGEGFSNLKAESDQSNFEIALSIENDKHAHQTLQLRSFYRQFSGKRVPEDYYHYIRGPEDSRWIDKEQLFNKHGAEAEAAINHAWKLTLGEENRVKVQQRIDEVLSSYKKNTPWILIGGPPCQAYSMAGRSRMKRTHGKQFEDDHRHVLYKEYLQIIQDHESNVFVMENVKGLLSSKLDGKLIYKMIFDDLRNAAGSNSYKLYSLVYPADTASTDLFEEDDFTPKDFIIESENYGIPQARHRVIILGVRQKGLKHIKSFNTEVLEKSLRPTTVESVISDLPALRSGLSRIEDTDKNWISVIKEIKSCAWLDEIRESEDPDLAKVILDVVKNIKPMSSGRGGQFVASESISSKYRPHWFHDRRIKGAVNHETKTHMESDIHRYLFCSAFAMHNGFTPKLRHFPQSLLPEHQNAEEAVKSGMFADRFRVQVSDLPATTVTSHIHKDGHAFIHPDPLQCRSLTVREAARIQTFPDNYFFEGPKTAQFKQVGNAVPPLLAMQIARIVRKLIKAHF